jgi:hypothetical protein
MVGGDDTNDWAFDQTEGMGAAGRWSAESVTPMGF